MQLQRTTTHTPGARLKPKWHVIDARGQRLGRLASSVAHVLQGKHTANYSAHELTGDFVVVVNAAEIDVTGNKRAQKIYYRHTGYVGHLRERTLDEMLAKFPTRVIEKAVKGMLPRNRLARRMLKRLKVYAAETHPHEAQVMAGTGARAAATAARAAAAAAAPPSRRPTTRRAARPKPPKGNMAEITAATVIEASVEEQVAVAKETPAPARPRKAAATKTGAKAQPAARSTRSRAKTADASPVDESTTAEEAKPKPARKPRATTATTPRRRTPPKDQE
jgi:large subunit ribosomal protein L13